MEFLEVRVGVGGLRAQQGAQVEVGTIWASRKGAAEARRAVVSLRKELQGIRRQGHGQGRRAFQGAPVAVISVRGGSPCGPVKSGQQADLHMY